MNVIKTYRITTASGKVIEMKAVVKTESEPESLIVELSEIQDEPVGPEPIPVPIGPPIKIKPVIDTPVVAQNNG
jgi:hypothetical protein